MLLAGVAFAFLILFLEFVVHKWGVPYLRKLPKHRRDCLVFSQVSEQLGVNLCIWNFKFVCRSLGFIFSTKREKSLTMGYIKGFHNRIPFHYN